MEIAAPEGRFIPICVAAVFCWREVQLFQQQLYARFDKFKKGRPSCAQGGEYAFRGNCGEGGYLSAEKIFNFIDQGLFSILLCFHAYIVARLRPAGLSHARSS